MARSSLAAVLVLIAGCAGSPSEAPPVEMDAGPPPPTPAELCRMARDHTTQCVMEYCRTAPATDTLCQATPAPADDCADGDATRAQTYLDMSCTEVVTFLHGTGGAADGFCPSWLCWLCDCSTRSTDACCVNCANSDTGEPEPACNWCFDFYGRDSNGDGRNDRVLAIRCTGSYYCGGCLDADCNGTCD